MVSGPQDIRVETLPQQGLVFVATGAQVSRVSTSVQHV